MIRRFAILAAALALGACQAEPKDSSRTARPADTEEATEPALAGPAEAGDAPGNMADTRAYDGIRADETVRFTGTEPFWGGQVSGTTLTYSTPEVPDGTPVAVTRFAGRGGVSWSGALQGKPFRLAVTEASCSDGMSDRTYPFTATLEVLGEQRQGCAWTERRSFTPQEAP